MKKINDNIGSIPDSVFEISRTMDCQYPLKSKEFEIKMKYFRKLQKTYPATFRRMNHNKDVVVIKNGSFFDYFPYRIKFLYDLLNTKTETIKGVFLIDKYNTICIVCHYR